MESLKEMNFYLFLFMNFASCQAFAHFPSIGIQFDFYISLKPFCIFHYFRHQFVYKKLRFFKTIQELELSFNELVFSISLFFVGILGYLLVTIK